MYEFILLLAAAILEVGGDALVRFGLQRRGLALMILGGCILVAYGFMVNLTKLDFSRLMGLYIVMFFLVAQTTAVLIFKERLHIGVICGGALVLAGGITMAVWRS